MPTEYFEQRERALLGPRYQQLYAAPQQTAERGVTVSALRTTPEQFAQRADFPLEPSPFCKAAFVVHQPDFKPGRHPYHHAGVFYSQEPSASSAAPLLGVQPGMRVLDLCAAPGGKSSQLAAALQGRGVLVSNEYVAARAEILKSNLERMGVSNAVVLNETPARIAEALPEFFDRVLVDAPCSGEGMFRKEPSMVKAWEQNGPEFYAALQEDILKQALPMLKPGGMLLYSTCTFSPLEDEGTVQKILSMNPDMEILPMEGYKGFASGKPELIGSTEESIRNCVRIFPHRVDGEGHFLALFRKKETADEPVVSCEQTRSGLRGEEKELWEAFGENLNRTFLPERMESKNGMVYYMPKELPKMRGLRFLRSGLFVGEMKKKRFEPSQSLAMALRAKDYKNCLRLSVNDERVVRYLKGETLVLTDEEAAAKDGWQLVCVEDYPLGWGKKNKHNLKNKYKIKIK